MIYLGLSVVSSSLIYLVFKLLGKFKIQTLPALVVNYITACIIGYTTNAQSIAWNGFLQKNWFYGSVVMGMLFILVFMLMANTTQKLGISVVSVASKMSVAIPVIFVIWYYQEPINTLQMIGIGLALIAVVLVSLRKKAAVQLGIISILLPLLVFFGSGVIESGLKFLEQEYVQPTEIGQFSMTVFFFAACFGGVYWLVKTKMITTSSHPSSWKEIAGGIALGIPNYFSIFFFLSALKSEFLPSSLLFVINNISIVLLSTLLGILLFKERISLKNWLGIGLAMVSMALIYFHA